MSRKSGKSRSHQRQVVPKNVCVFCMRDTDDELKFGKLHSWHSPPFRIHYFCMLFASALEQHGTDEQGILGFLPEDIMRERQRGNKLICHYCKKKGATIGCCSNRCRLTFHLPCGLEHDTFHRFLGDFPSFCKRHAPKQNIPKDCFKNSEPNNCPICLLPMEAIDDGKTIYAPCCQKLMHLLCLQKFAIASGYFFRCPLCNNKDVFLHEVQEFGIYVPEQDAAWELEPNAFNELLQRHSRCDASECLCMQGRDYNLGSWKIVLCRLCGAKGCHTKCGNLKSSSTTTWECSECVSILNKQRCDQNNVLGASRGATIEISERPQRGIKRKRKCQRNMQSKVKASSEEDDMFAKEERIIVRSKITDEIIDVGEEALPIPENQESFAVEPTVKTVSGLDGDVSWEIPSKTRKAKRPKKRKKYGISLRRCIQNDVLAADNARSSDREKPSKEECGQALSNVSVAEGDSQSSLVSTQLQPAPRIEDKEQEHLEMDCVIIEMARTADSDGELGWMSPSLVKHQRSDASPSGSANQAGETSFQHDSAPAKENQNPKENIVSCADSASLQLAKHQEEFITMKKKKKKKKDKKKKKKDKKKHREEFPSKKRKKDKCSVHQSMKLKLKAQPQQQQKLKQLTLLQFLVCKTQVIASSANLPPKG